MSTAADNAASIARSARGHAHVSGSTLVRAKTRIRGLSRAALICILVGTLPTYGMHREISPGDVRLAAGAADYLLDGASVFAEYDAANSLNARYLLHPQVIDEMLSFEQGGAAYWPVTDALGSVVAITDAAGAVVRTNSYDVYGARTSSGSGPVIASGYAGREHDATGSIKMRNRDLDPATGRWTQPDRLGDVDGPNLYQYARGNPIVFRDPTGRIVEVLMLEPQSAFAASFGHIAVRVDFDVYSFEGQDKQSARMQKRSWTQYRLRENDREILGIQVRLTPEQEQIIRVDLSKFEGKYNFIRNNCTHPFQFALAKAGVSLESTTSPAELMNEIASSGYGVDWHLYQSQLENSDPPGLIGKITWFNVKGYVRSALEKGSR